MHGYTGVARRCVWELSTGVGKWGWKVETPISMKEGLASLCPLTFCFQNSGKRQLIAFF